MLLTPILPPSFLPPSFQTNLKNSSQVSDFFISTLSPPSPTTVPSLHHFCLLSLLRNLPFSAPLPALPAHLRDAMRVIINKSVNRSIVRGWGANWDEEGVLDLSGVR